MDVTATKMKATFLPCRICDGKGTYLDRRCLSEECAHLLGPKNKDGNREVVMPCPKRPCSCSAGAEARAALKARVETQNNLMQLQSSWGR